MGDHSLRTIKRGSYKVDHSLRAVNCDFSKVDCGVLSVDDSSRKVKLGPYAVDLDPHRSIIICLIQKAYFVPDTTWHTFNRVVKIFYDSYKQK